MVTPNSEGESVLLEAGRYSLELDPLNGGSITRFDWDGFQLFRSAVGSAILDQACFPLVPFSNRIASGRFRFEGREIALPPNFPGSDHPHTIHGFGWRSQWTILRRSGRSCLLAHSHAGGDWPWPYRAEQELTLSDTGLRHVLRMTNVGRHVMPAGLGFHPYFPISPAARYLGLHTTEWVTDEDGLPSKQTTLADPADWWLGTPVQSRTIDTAYTGRKGPILLTWPETGIRLQIDPSDNLDTTVVYVPSGEQFFCVEPVTHTTDAFNRADGQGLRRLMPKDQIEICVEYSASKIG